MPTLHTRTHQQGSAVVWTIMLLVIVMFAALVVDGSGLYRQQRMMQSMANALATELANDAKACGGSLADDTPLALSASAQQLLASRFGDQDLAGMQTTAMRTLVNSTGGQHHIEPVGHFAQSNAVTVTLKQPYTGLLMFVFPELSAAATARKEVLASFSSDARTLTLDTSQSQLLSLVWSDILGVPTPLRLELLDLDALQRVIVDVDALLTSLPLAGEALDTILGSEMLASTVLQALRSVESVANSGLAPLIDEVLRGANIDTNIRLRDLIDVVGAGNRVPGARIPALQLVSGIIMDVGKSLNKKVHLSLDGLNAVTGPLNSLLGGLGLVEIDLKALEVELDLDRPSTQVTAPARQDANGSWLGQTRGGDIALKVTTNLSAKVLNLGLIQGVRLDIALPLMVEVANASASFTSAECARGNSNEVRLGFQSSRRLLDLTAMVDVGVAVLGPLLGVDVDVKLGPVPQQQGSGREMWINGYDLETGQVNHMLPPGCSTTNAGIVCDLPDQLELGVAALLGSLDLDVKVKVLGLDPLGLLSALLSPVKLLLVPLLSNVVGGLVEGIVNSVVQPLLQALGVNLVAAGLTIAGVSQPQVVLLEGCGVGICAL